MLIRCALKLKLLIKLVNILPLIQTKKYKIIIIMIIIMIMITIMIMIIIPDVTILDVTYFFGRNCE